MNKKARSLLQNKCFKKGEAGEVKGKVVGQSIQVGNKTRSYNDEEKCSNGKGLVMKGNEAKNPIPMTSPRRRGPEQKKKKGGKKRHKMSNEFGNSEV